MLGDPDDAVDGGVSVLIIDASEPSVSSSG